MIKAGRRRESQRLENTVRHFPTRPHDTRGAASHSEDTILPDDFATRPERRGTHAVHFSLHGAVSRRSTAGGAPRHATAERGEGGARAARFPEQKQTDKRTHTHTRTRMGFQVLSLLLVPGPLEARPGESASPRRRRRGKGGPAARSARHTARGWRIGGRKEEFSGGAAEEGGRGRRGGR